MCTRLNNKKIVLLIIIILINFSCNNVNKNLERFSEIKKGMTKEIVDEVLSFKEDKNVGHGLAIDLYNLSDGSSIRIGYSDNKVIYILHNEKKILE